MEIEINSQFKDLFALIEETTENVFITGRAGTGKSTFLTLFRDETRKQVVVLAPTGVAAVNVKGETIHSFFKFKPDVTVEKARDIARKSITALYKTVETIIIDEISMVRADLLDCIDEFLKITRKSFLPFGGVQMIFIGDLYQLPPVVTRQDRDALLQVYETPFFFSAEVMRNCGFKIFELEKIYRQTDVKFVELLNKVRDNSVDFDDLKLLNSRHIKDFSQQKDDLYIYLTTTNDLAANLNTEMMKKIDSQEFIFKGDLKGDFERGALPTEEVLTLKIGAQVMTVNNDPQGRWINGTIGKVIQIEKDKEGELVRIEKDDGTIVDVVPNNWDMYEFTVDEKTNKLVSNITGSFSQYPLKLAWAITIHKSQGKTFEKVVIDFGRGAFAPGQVYVALSRSRSFEGIILRSPVNRRDIWTDKSIVSFLLNGPTPPNQKTLFET